MASKRKDRPGLDAGEAKKSRADGGMFESQAFFLHPAALSKVRRDIFQKQIAKQGGELLDKIRGCNKATVLLEDTLTDRDRVQTVAEKVVAENKAEFDLGAIELVGLSWLSKCLEAGEVVSKNEYIITVTTTVHSTLAVSTSAPEQSNQDNKDEEKEPQGRYIDRNKHKFVCSRSSENAAEGNLNKHITDELEKLAAAYKSSNDTWRAFGYQKAISALKNHPRRVESRAEASAIPNVGAKMADKIMEIVESGSLRKVREVCDGERMRTLDLFGRVWGAGPATAEKWYEQGLRTLEDLRQRGNLNKHQEIGLRLFDDLDERMNREECTEILQQIKDVAWKIRPDLEIIGCGSYRRGKATCGDLDVLITHKEESALEGLFEKILQDLKSIGFLTDDLTIQKDGRQRKYLGVCKLLKPDSKHRRLDIIVVPPDERACALLYFTGSAHFNRSMRLLATKMGMSLSEHALVSEVARGAGREKLNEGRVLDTPQEKDVFDVLGLPYREPHERNH